ncbi:MAG: mevalonate kinase [archaeon]
MIKASAPSKLMLFGEHALLYGEPAIATAVDKRAHVTACELEKPRIVIERKESDESIDISIKDKSDHPIAKAVQATLKHLNKNVGIGIEIDNGVTDSAAIISATTGAVMKLLTDNLIKPEVAEVSYETGKLLNNGTNGIDSTVTTFGGTVMFEKGQGRTVPIHNDLSFVIGDTGIRSDPNELIAKIKTVAEDPKVALMVFSIGSLVRRANNALIAGNPLEIGRLMDMNHVFLRNLGVSNQSLENIIEAAKETGAFGAKITGTGGEGTVIALTDKPNEVAKAMKEAGAVKAFSIKSNQEGVRIE